MPTAWYFLPTAAESTQRTPSKPMVLKTFARLGCRPRGSLLPREPDAQVYHLAFVSSLRLQPLAAPAAPRGPGGTGMPAAPTAQTGNPSHFMSRTRRGDPRGRPPARASLPSIGAGFSCPPSCQSIPGHCRVRQSGHFLETGSLTLAGKLAETAGFLTA